jgi:signal peptidase II
MKPFIKALIGGCILFFIDRITKLWALSACAHGPVLFSPFMACTLCFNSGSCWSLLPGNSPFQYYFLILVISALIVLLIYQILYKIKMRESIWPEILIIAGALGNLYDRFVYAGVIDFILIFFRNFYWPIFNCADCFVVIGISILLIQNCFSHKKLYE